LNFVRTERGAACLLLVVTMVSCGTTSTPDSTGGNCVFELDASLSEAVPTVGIVTWSLPGRAPTSAHVELGLDTSYGLFSPVDLSEPNFRTVLLGMKASRDYHVRIVAHDSSGTCKSDDFVLTTGPLPNGLLPRVTVDTLNPAARAGGYVVSSFLKTGPSFILDADGDYVWWHGTGEIGRAEQSYDGKALWAGDRTLAPEVGRITRVSMDGLEAEVLPEFGNCHHDFTVLPDESVGFIRYDGDCDAIMERAPDGSVHEVINVRDAHGGTAMCHTNSIHYQASDDTYTFSDLNQDAYAKVTRAGEVVWVLGGATSDFTGDGASWEGQHGHDLIAADRLLFFNNGDTGKNAVAVEVSLDLDTMTATRVASYDPGIATRIYGDVQRLDNGNTLVTFGSAGVMHELDPNGELVESLTFALGGALGYVTKRASLYGPPPAR
jgi:hypothetical protein